MLWLTCKTKNKSYICRASGVPRSPNAVVQTTCNCAPFFSITSKAQNSKSLPECVSALWRCSKICRYNLLLSISVFWSLLVLISSITASPRLRGCHSIKLVINLSSCQQNWGYPAYQMGYNLLKHGIYWGYKPRTNHLQNSWDIQEIEKVLKINGWKIHNWWLDPPM